MAKEQYPIYLEPETLQHLKEQAKALNLTHSVLARFYIQKGLQEKNVLIVKVRQGKVTCPVLNYEIENIEVDEKCR